MSNELLAKLLLLILGAIFFASIMHKYTKRKKVDQEWVRPPTPFETSMALGEIVDDALPPVGFGMPDSFGKRFEVSVKNPELKKPTALLAMTATIIPAIITVYSLLFSTADGFDTFLKFLILALMAFYGFFAWQSWLRYKAIAAYPVLLQIFDEGIWFPPHRLYVPHERVRRIDALPVYGPDGSSVVDISLQFEIVLSDRDKVALGTPNLATELKRLFVFGNVLSITFQGYGGFDPPSPEDIIKKITAIATKQNLKSHAPPPTFSIHPAVLVT